MSQRSNTIKAAGLYTYLSELQAPEGSQVIADNVNIDELGVLTPRRGFNDYGQVLSESDSTFRVKQVLEYKNRIIRYYDTKLEFDDGNGNFSLFSGDFNEVESGYRIKSQEVNGNLYFTTAEGIKKISARTASQFSTSPDYILQAGAPKGVTLSAKTLPTSSGFLSPQSKVAYKVLFGYRDANNALILGSPTSRFVVTNNSRDVNVREQVNVAFERSETASSPFNYIGKYFTAETLDQGYYVWFSESGTSTTEPQDGGTIGRIGIEVPIAPSDTSAQIAQKTANVLFNEFADEYTVSISGSTVRFVSKEDGNIDDFTVGTLTVTTDLTITVIQDGTVSEGTNADCEIQTIIPNGVDSRYFVQLYRTSVISTVTGQEINDIDPGEDCNLVFEEPVTGSAGDIITITDRTPNGFRDNGVPLYNNPITGQGILQSNDLPPISKDIEFFNNYTFYANTKTFHRKTLTFVSVDDFKDQETSIVIGNEDIAREYVFAGTKEITDITCGTVDNTTETTALNDSYIILYSANDERKYYIWFDKGTGVDPLIQDATSIKIDLSVDGILGADNVGQYLELALLEFDDFVTEYDEINTITITNINNGVTTNTDTPTSTPATDIGTGWAISVTEGTGEDSATNKVLWSVLPSVGQAIEETARSFVKIINQDTSSPVIATYFSGENDLPGNILLEGKTLEDKTFYIGVKNTGTIGSAISGEFNPNIPFIDTDVTGIAVSAADATQTRITSTAHGLVTGDEVYISASNNDPIINNKYEITRIDDDNFDIDLVTVTGNSTNAFFFSASEESDNEERQNRIYYSKLGQPEAVPIVNFLDVGGKDEPIERILALRDTLFVLKTDGVFTITGFGPPFNQRILDNTANIIAPDSAVVLDNKIFALTNHGISVITESGLSVISRSIENKLLAVTGTDVDFRLKTFAVSYENDRAYILWLPTTSEDGTATQAYRYNHYEKTWTRWTVPATSAGVSRKQNVLYIGDGTRNYLQKERKNRDRTDYADRNFTLQLPVNAIEGKTLRLSSIANVNTGDVILQNQYVTIEVFNNLLMKLDIDTFVVSKDYEETLRISAGANIASALNLLNDKLIADGTVVTDYIWDNNDWEDLKIKFNSLIDELNGEASGTQYKNYNKVDQFTTYESIIVSKNTIRPDRNEVGVLIDTRFLEGNIEIFKSINTEIQWAPLHFGDPSAQKQFSRSTILVDQNNFTEATVSYSTDLSQGFVPIVKQGKGAGYWSSGTYGDANFYWGGGGNDSPLMNIVPREKQRGRYLNIKLQHNIAREGFRVLGVTCVVRVVSARGYR